MTIKNNLISWTPTANQSGTNQVTVKVTDSQGGSTTQSFSIRTYATGTRRSAERALFSTYVL